MNVIPASTHADLPLVVDLDGTLIRSDLLVESFFALLSAAPLRAVASLSALASGRAALKARLAANARIDAASLPFNEALLTFLRAEHARGRPIYLASASDEFYVRAVAETLGLFSGIFASANGVNLRASAKAEALVKAFGRGGFDYAGNSADDLKVWEQGASAIVVNAPQSLLRRVRDRHPDATSIGPPEAAFRDYARALRPHQWLKNLLILVPAFTAHRFDVASALACFIAFLSFSACASSVYLLNDLLDLRSDRAHPTKRLRPFAAGRIDARHGILMFLACLAIAGLLGLLLPWDFLAVLTGYFVLSTAYSVYLKRKVVLDVQTLACLYGVRMIAGAAAVGVDLSPWLIMFSVFFFLCLALVKRCTEMIERRAQGLANPPGRGYRLSDLPALQTMASSCGHVSVLVFILYVNSAGVVALYGHPERLWLIPLLLLYWVSRLMILTQRGDIHEDPVLWAVQDRVSLLAVGCVIIAICASL